MMQNQSGFVLPFTLMVTTILIFFFLNQLNMYVLEKKYYYEAEGVMVADSLMELTIRHLKKGIQDERIHEGNFTWEFREGKANVTIKTEEITEKIETGLDVEDMKTETGGEHEVTSRLFHIIITCITNNQMQYRVTFTYDEALDTIFNWVE